MNTQPKRTPAAARHAESLAKALSGASVVGLYGGSFNPIHVGHVALARQMLRAAGLDSILFMVSPLNPFKQAAPDLLDDDLRLALVRKALKGEPRLIASDYEFRLPKPSYTWQTFQALAKDFAGVEFVLLIGADNWLAFDRWGHYQDILATHRIAIYPRAGYPIEAATLPEGVMLMDTELYNVSSSDIRRRVATGQPIGGMVPPAIEADVMRMYGSANG